MSDLDRIQTDPEIMRGKPVIKGTRITVELVLRRLADGVSVDELLEAYPHLERSDILAAFQYASDLIANEEIIVPRAS